MATLNDEFLYQVFAIVEEIPLGTVATYGQIARLSGHDKNARLVGKALSLSEYFGKYPCHRVVHQDGLNKKIYSLKKVLLLKKMVVLI